MTENSAQSIQEEVRSLLEQLGVPAQTLSSGDLSVHSPITGEVIARIPQTTPDEAAVAIATAHQAFLEWRSVPAPRRGELVRLLGEELRASRAALGRLVTIEAAKI